MGMDVYGNAPASETGKYFRNNVWHWRPLANYVASVAPSLYSDSWQYNDGKGLSRKDSLKLASILQAEIDNGNTAAYAINFLRRLQELPDEECNLCYGSGKRNGAIMVGTCNKCEGKGHTRPFDTWYYFDVPNVASFVAFLRDCGGFKIW